MNRRNALKSLTGLSALAFLPKQHLFALQQKKPIHFVGLGKAGSNVMMHIQGLEKEAQYSAITSPGHLKPSQHVKLMPYVPHQLTSYRERLKMELYFPEDLEPFQLPPETSKLFEADHHYVLLTGLGGYTGTHFCDNLIPFLQETNKAFTAICSVPFRFEGKKKMDMAMEVVNRFYAIPQFQYFQNEAMREKFGNRTMNEVFSRLDEEFYGEWKSSRRA